MNVVSSPRNISSLVLMLSKLQKDNTQTWQMRSVAILMFFTSVILTAVQYYFGYMIYMLQMNGGEGPTMNPVMTATEYTMVFCIFTLLNMIQAQQIKNLI